MQLGLVVEVAKEGEDKPCKMEGDGRGRLTLEKDMTVLPSKRVSSSSTPTSGGTLMKILVK